MNDPQLVQKIVKECCHFHLVDLSCTHSSMDYVVKHRALREYMVNQQDENDNNPLHVAASIGDDEILNALLESLPGVLKELPNKEGLTFYGVAKARKQHEDKEKRENRDRKMKTTNEVQSSFIVVATLITTVTFTTAFTLPGGVNQEEPIKGMAVLVAKTDFDVFLMCDSLAMCSSIVSIALLIHLPGMRIGCIFIFLRLAAIECLKVSSFYYLLAFQKGVVLVDFQHYKLPGFAVSAVIVFTGIGVLIFFFFPYQSSG